MQVHGDAIAERVLSVFDALPNKAKPRSRGAERREWIVLSGIVLFHEASNTFECVALGTGMRCLPASKIPLANGRQLHDWHAEIIAIRAFNLFLLQECAKLAIPESSFSTYVRKRDKTEISEISFQPFILRDGIRIYMYSSDAPCGDASMELTMASQKDSSPWPISTIIDDGSETQLQGRGHFSLLGATRRKPSRGDAPMTLSKSCSDKLALKQFTSLLSSLTSLLIVPETAYLDTLVLPETKYIEASTTRAFSSTGRLATMFANRNITTSWAGGYDYHPFALQTTSQEFMYSRPNQSCTTTYQGSNISAMWTPGKEEVLIGGRVQGHNLSSIRGASSVSRYCQWQMVRNLIAGLSSSSLNHFRRLQTYSNIKDLELLRSRRQVKEDVRRCALKNWTQNSGDDMFGLEEMS